MSSASDIQSVSDQVHTVGVATIPELIDADCVKQLRDRLEVCIKEDLDRFGDQYIDRWMVLNLMARDVKFALLMEDERLQAHLCDLLGDTCIVYAYTSSSMPPGGSNYSHRIHVDCPRVIPGYITNLGVMIALDDYTAENGATWFLPGSFERLDPPSEEEFRANAVRVFPRAGDAVIFNARMWHLGDHNHTDRPRHALTMNVCRSFMRQRFDYPRLVPAEIVDQLSETGRRFLGFNVRMPTTLSEFYVPESERLYKTNQG